MKNVLEKGEKSILLPEGEGGALTGEVHLIKFDDKKYVVRICSDLKKARYYESISKKLEKHGFLPKFLGRFGKNVFYEYIEGRDLKHEEKRDIFEQLGFIGAYVNKIKVNEDVDKGFNDSLNQLVSGKFKPSVKVLMRRKKSKIRKKPRVVFSKKEANKVKRLYIYLKKKARPSVTLDISDFIPGNFRLRKGKVYLVDVESIKPAFKGKGVAKCFRGLCKTKRRRELFMNGYSKVSSIKFFNRSYEDFCHLLFIVQALHFKTQVARNYSDDLVKLNYLFEKYNKVLS